MNLLLPHSFKRAGLLMAPLGFILWLCMQFGFVTKLLASIKGYDINEMASSPAIFHTINVIVATISFFSFLVGLYFIAFSKEKVEDEMIQKTRLDSFQFAALIQMVFVIAGFTWMFLYNEPGKEGMLLFFVTALFGFWLSFIGRFNYILHIRLR